MSTSDSRDYELIDRLAEEFAELIRAGERPSVQEYCDKYPHIAADLRDMLPALAEVEQVKDQAVPPSAEAPKLRQVDEYHILREVGRGGMGVVYEAEDTRLGRRVALKVLAGGKSGHGLERFKREARAAARLHHTNIVPVFGVGDHDGVPYYVMQFIQGLGLDEVLEEVKRMQALSGAVVPPSAVSARPPRRDVSAAAVAQSLVTGTFDPPAVEETLTHAPVVGTGLQACASPAGLEACRHDSASSISLPGQSHHSGRKLSYWQSIAQIGLQVADALDYAHKQGVLHRDIKPSNLLLDLHGVVWVTDFGLAKASDQEDLTHTGDVLGTLRYMPPEAFEGKSDARSDLYALGLSLYELLALRPAFDERKREAIIKQVTTTDPPRLGVVNRTIPRDLQTVVHKAIEKDPGHRYQSAAALAADLRRFLGDHTILARRVSPAERFARWCKRNPTVAGLTAAVFLLMTAVAVVSSVLALRIEKKAGEIQIALGQAQTATDLANAETERKKVALEREEKERRRTEELLGDQFVRSGARLLAEGDVGGAAVNYVEALRLDGNDPERANGHRIRLTAALRDAPRPRQVWFHDATVSCTAVSPDGTLVACGCEDGTIHVWNIATGDAARAPLKVERAVSQLMFASADRLWSISIGPDSAKEPVAGNPNLSRSTQLYHLSQWDLSTGTARVRRTGIHSFPQPTSDGSIGWIRSSLPKGIHEFLDPVSGEPVGPAIQNTDEQTDNAFAWSARVNRVLLAQIFLGKVARGEPTRGKVQLLDAKTGQMVGTSIPIIPTIGWYTVFCAPDDRRALVVDAAGDLVWLDSATGKVVNHQPSPGGRSVSQLLVSADGRRVLATYSSSRNFGGGGIGTDDLARLFDGLTGRPVGPAWVVAAGSTVFGGGRGFGTSSFQINQAGTHLIANDGGRIRLLQPDGTPVTAQPTHAGNARRGLFSPDGGYLLTLGADNTARVWFANTGTPVGPQLVHTGPVSQAQFTPDGSQMVLASGAGVWVWPVVRDTVAQGPPIDNTRSVTRISSADGRRLLEFSAGRLPFGIQPEPGTARIVDATTGKVVAGPILLPEEAGRADRYSWAGDFRPDGQAAVFVRTGFRSSPSAPSIPPTAFFWDCSTDRMVPLALQTRIPFVPVPVPVAVVSNLLANFSHDGRFILTSFVGGARLWDAKTGVPAGPLVMYRPWGTNAGGLDDRAALLAPDASRLVIVEMHDKARRIRLIDPQTGADIDSLRAVPGDNALISVSFNADGTRLMTAFTSSVGGFGPGNVFQGDTTRAAQVWDTVTGAALTPPLDATRFGGPIARAVLSPGGDQVAFIVGIGPSDYFEVNVVRDTMANVHVWGINAGREIVAPLAHEVGVVDLQFAPAGDRLLTVPATGPARLWSLTSGELVQLLACPVGTSSARFAPDGRRVLFSTGGDRVAGGVFSPSQQVVEVRTGQPLTPQLPNASAGPNTGNQSVNQNVDRFLVGGRRGTTVSLYSLDPDDRPVADLRALAELFAGRQVNAAGLLQGLGATGFRDAWAAGRERFPSDLSEPVMENTAWHRSNIPVSVQAASGLLNRGPGASGTPRWHYDRLLAVNPNDPKDRAARGNLLVDLDEYEKAEADLTYSLERTANPPFNRFLRRADARAAQGKWAEAEADAIEAVARMPRGGLGGAVGLGGGFFGTGRGLPQAAAALLKFRRGSVKDYRAAGDDFLKTLPRPTKKGNFGGPGSVQPLWVLLLADDLPTEWETYLESTIGRNQFSIGGSVPFSNLAALYYRTGQYDKAEAALTSSEVHGPGDWFLLAMAQHKQGKASASDSLAAGRRALAEVPFGDRMAAFAPQLRMPPWQIDLVEQLLLKEAEAMIEGKK